MRAVTIPKCRIIPLLIILVTALATAAAADTYVRPTLRELTHSKGQNKAVVGIIEGIQGVSYVHRARKSGRTDTFLGLRLFEGDRVSSDKSRVHVRYKDGTYVEMGAESSLEVERLRFKPANPLPENAAANQYDETVFRFSQGLVRISAADVHVLSQFTIKTTNAILKVTGPSDFYMIQLPNERELTVRVVRGKVEVINVVTNEKLAVPPGTGAFVKVSGLVTHAGAFTTEQFDFLKSRTSI